jgi:hypothetical protein
MQAAVDGARDGGLVEMPSNVRLPFIEPAHLRAGFDMNNLLMPHEQVGDALIWFAVWNDSRNLATVIDVSADELDPCEHSLRCAHRGDHYAGPFPSQRQAQEFAIEKLAAGIKGT